MAEQAIPSLREAVDTALEAKTFEDLGVSGIGEYGNLVYKGRDETVEEYIARMTDMQTELATVLVDIDQRSKTSLGKHAVIALLEMATQGIEEISSDSGQQG